MSDGRRQRMAPYPFVFRAGRADLLGQFSLLLSLYLTSSLGNFSIHFRLTLRAEISSSCILSNFAPSLSLQMCLSPSLSSFLLLPSFNGSHIYDLSSGPPTHVNVTNQVILTLLSAYLRNQFPYKCGRLTCLPQRSVLPSAEMCPNDPS